MFEDGVRGDALDAVVTDLASDISRGVVQGCDGLWFERAVRKRSIKLMRLAAFALDRIGFVAISIE